MTITRDLARQMHRDLVAAADEVAKKYGLTAYVGGARFDASMSRMKVEFRTAAAMDVVVSPALGMKAHELLGLPILLRSKLYKVIDVNPNRPKNAVTIARVDDGRQYRCSLAIAIAGREAAKNLNASVGGGR